MTSHPTGPFLVDPVWVLSDGFLHPVDWSRVPRSALASDIVEVLRRCPVDNASLLLRGSILEQARPHPEADLDIMIVTEDRRAASVDLSELETIGRSVDAVLVEGDRDRVLWAAAYTRALHVGGTPHTPRPIPLDRQLLVDHWLKYSAFSLPPVLRSQGLRRLAEVKRVLRAIGLVYGLQTGRFSRDLHTCLKAAAEETPRLAKDAEALFNTVQANPSPDYDITDMQGWLRLHFYERIEAWDTGVQTNANAGFHPPPGADEALRATAMRGSLRATEG